MWATTAHCNCTVTVFISFVASLVAPSEDLLFLIFTSIESEDTFFFETSFDVFFDPNLFVVVFGIENDNSFQGLWASYRDTGMTSAGGMT